MKLLKTGVTLLSGAGAGYGAYLYKELQPSYEVNLFEDARYLPFIRLERNPDFTYGGRVATKSGLSVRLHNTLITELKIPGDENISMTANTTFGAGMKESQIEKDLYVMLDTMMGGVSAFYLRKRGDFKGTATSYINMERHGKLEANRKYQIAILCHNQDGKNFFNKGVVADDTGRIVRTYTSRFVKVPWTTRVLIRMHKSQTSSQK